MAREQRNEVEILIQAHVRQSHRRCSGLIAVCFIVAGLAVGGWPGPLLVAAGIVVIILRADRCPARPQSHPRVRGLDEEGPEQLDMVEREIK